jgi:hypothetical protein
VRDTAALEIWGLFAGVVKSPGSYTVVELIDFDRLELFLATV